MFDVAVAENMYYCLFLNSPQNRMIFLEPELPLKSRKIKVYIMMNKSKFLYNKVRNKKTTQAATHLNSGI